jgi:hypothetical protein
VRHEPASAARLGADLSTDRRRCLPATIRSGMPRLPTWTGRWRHQDAQVATAESAEPCSSCLISLICGNRTRGRIRTDDLPITSRSLTLRLDPPRLILAAQVRDRFHLVPPSSAWYQPLGCHSGYHLAPSTPASRGGRGTLSIRSRSDAHSRRAAVIGDCNRPRRNPCRPRHLIGRRAAVMAACRSPAGRLSRLAPGALAGPQHVDSRPLREPVGILPLQLEHPLGVVEERLTRAVEERLLPSRVQLAELALQRLIVQLMWIQAELPRHGSPLPPSSRPTPSPAMDPGRGDPTNAAVDRRQCGPGWLAARPCLQATAHSVR